MSRCYELYMVMGDRLNEVVVGDASKILRSYYLSRIEKLNASDAPFREWVKLLEQEKREAVKQARRCAFWKGYDGRLYGTESIIYRSDCEHLNVHKAAAKVLIAFHREVRNAHAAQG